MEIHIKVDVSLAVYYLIQLVFLVFLQMLFSIVLVNMNSHASKINSF